jgi:ribosomal protein L35AE/L33A
MTLLTALHLPQRSVVCQIKKTKRKRQAKKYRGKMIMFNTKMPGENVYKLVDQSFLHISLWLLFVGS